MPATLPDQAKAWLDAPTFPTLGVVGPDGAPQLTVHWVGRDGDDVLMSTVQGRKHERYLRANPACSVLLINPEDPYSYLEVRGTATLTEEGGRELIDSFAKKYRDLDTYPWDTPDAVRVVIRITPDKVVLH